ncbi:zeta toxin family protein [Streptomyces sp. NPDC056944]|uniref:zeta toxin family protein n=1 Tax=Streptomyces sp. NPDC056944 TaxID=3345972 RepID=UPI00362B54EF
MVVSAPLGGPDWALDRFAEFRKAGYRVGVDVVATHEAMSVQGIVHRYHRARQPDQVGYGRWVPPEIHDQGCTRESWTPRMPSTDSRPSTRSTWPAGQASSCTSTSPPPTAGASG